MNCGSPPPSVPFEVSPESIAATEVCKANIKQMIASQIVAYLKLRISPPNLDSPHAGYSNQFRRFFP
jgi:hypothetical protein